MQSPFNFPPFFKKNLTSSDSHSDKKSDNEMKENNKELEAVKENKKTVTNQNAMPDVSLFPKNSIETHEKHLFIVVKRKTNLCDGINSQKKHNNKKVFLQQFRSSLSLKIQDITGLDDEQKLRKKLAVKKEPPLPKENKITARNRIPSKSSLPSSSPQKRKRLDQLPGSFPVRPPSSNKKQPTVFSLNNQRKRKTKESPNAIRTSNKRSKREQEEEEENHEDEEDYYDEEAIEEEINNNDGFDNTEENETPKEGKSTTPEEEEEEKRNAKKTTVVEEEKTEEQICKVANKEKKKTKSLSFNKFMLETDSFLDDSLCSASGYPVSSFSVPLFGNANSKNNNTNNSLVFSPLGSSSTSSIPKILSLLFSIYSASSICYTDYQFIHWKERYVSTIHVYYLREEFASIMAVISKTMSLNSEYVKSMKLMNLFIDRWFKNSYKKIIREEEENGNSTEEDEDCEEQATRSKREKPFQTNLYHHLPLSLVPLCSNHSSTVLSQSHLESINSLTFSLSCFQKSRQ